jgi:tetratricopeptide (TPR) repeat protein
LLRIEALAENAQGHTEQAERILRAASEKLPQEPGIFETLSRIYLFTQRYPEALEAIRRQLQLVPDNTAALRNEGATYIQMGGLATDPAEKTKKYEQAIPPLTRALEINPTDSAALMNRAIAYLQSGKLAEAQKDYEALRKIMPTYFPVYYGLAEVAYRQKNARNAIANYQLYLKYAPANTLEGDEVRKKLEQARAGTLQ